MSPAHVALAPVQSRGRRSAAIWCATLLTSSCAAASLPSVQVVVNARGEAVSPLAAGAGFVLTGKRLTVWRPTRLSERRSVGDQPGAIALARDGRACATAAMAPALGLRSYRLPGLEAVRQVEACNGKLDISANGALVACLERRAEAAELQTFVRVFTFPDLQPVQSWGPLVESVDALSFVGASAERLAVATTLLAPPRGPNDFRTRIDLYDVRSAKVVADFSRAGRYPYLAFAPQGDAFVWAGQSGVEAWSVRSFTKVRTFSATAHTIAVALSPDGRMPAASQQERSAGDLHPGGGGNIQVFDMQSGELVARFGSADLRSAANPQESDAMLTDRAKLRVHFVFMGTPTGSDRRFGVRDSFGGPGYVANHEQLAFSDSSTLVSTSRGFFALWNLNDAAIRNARRNE